MCVRHPAKRNLSFNSPELSNTGTLGEATQFPCNALGSIPSSRKPLQQPSQTKQKPQMLYPEK